MSKWTKEQRDATRIAFPTLTEEQVAFIEKADEFADKRPDRIPDEVWGQQVILFLQTEGAYLKAWEALGESLADSRHLSKATLRIKHPFGTCLAAVLKALQ